MSLSSDGRWVSVNNFLPDRGVDVIWWNAVENKYCYGWIAKNSPNICIHERHHAHSVVNFRIALEDGVLTHWMMPVAPLELDRKGLLK